MTQQRDTLQVIIDSTHAQLAYLDPQFNFVHVNAAYAQGSGHSQEELLGRNHFDLFPNPENQATFEQVRDTGQPIEFHAKPFEFADQPERGVTYWDWILVPDKGRKGQVQGLVLSLTDVTERERAQMALRRYADRLRVLYEIDRAILAAQTAEEIANVTLLHLHKLVPYQVASVELFDLELGEGSVLRVHAEGETSLETGHRHRLVWHEPIEALREGRLYIVEDIQTVPANSLVEALQDEGVRSFASIPLIVQGELVGSLNLGMSACGHLTSEQKEIARELADQLAVAIQQTRLHEQVHRHADELEQLVAERTAELQASEARFRAIYEHTVIGVLLADVEGRLTAANPAAQEMLGYSERELQGMMYKEITHPDDVATSARLYQELVAGECDHYALDKRYIRKDGRVIWARLVVSRIRGTDSQSRYAVAMVEDITEQKQAREALIQSEKMAIAGRLAASLAHEINNPLQSVIGCLGLAEEMLPEGEDVGRYLRIAHEELRRVADILGRLRHLDGPTERVEREPTDVNALLEKVLMLTKKQCQDRRVEVVWKASDDLPPLLLTSDRIRQVFLNLVLNAIDAMPDGGHLKVSTAPTCEPDGVLVTFADSGVGIPSDDLPHIFDSFHSSKPGGLGLGLFVSQSIVNRHGGRIEVDSQVGEGTTFTVWLPE